MYTSLRDSKNEPVGGSTVVVHFQLCIVAVCYLLDMGKYAKTRRSPKKSARAASPQKDVDVSGEVSRDEEQALATNTKGNDVVPSTPATSSSAGPDPQLSQDSALIQILASLQRIEAENKAMQLCLSALEQSGALATPAEDDLVENIMSSDEVKNIPEDIVYVDEVARPAHDNVIIDSTGTDTGSHMWTRC